MSDLISRSELLKALSEAEDNYRAEHHDCVMNDDPFSDGILSAMFSVLQIVKSQPTAYNQDKVVEEIIEEYGCHNCEQADTMACNECAELDVLNDICDIVKNGGVSDDACEWHCDEYGRYHTECHVLADNDPLEYTYCPYCGKKIKVVE